MAIYLMWRQGLSIREAKEVEFAQLYVRDFGHGTDGDSRLRVVAKLASLLDDAGVDQSFPYAAKLDVEAFMKWLEDGKEQPVITAVSVIVRARASEKRGEKRFIVSSGMEDDLLPTPVPARFLTPIVSDPPMSQGNKP